MTYQTSMEITLLIFVSIILFLLTLPYLKIIFKIIFKKTNFAQMGISSKIRLIHQLNDAITRLSKNKIGAIITIVRKDSLDKHRTDGILTNANISSQIILSLFNKSSPLHDGALIIEGTKIKYVSTFYKISNKSIDNKYGARHRAAMGICEITDSLTIVVSEENGQIVFAKSGEFIPINLHSFQEKLAFYLKD